MTIFIDTNTGLNIRVKRRETDKVLVNLYVSQLVEQICEMRTY